MDPHPGDNQRGGRQVLTNRRVGGLVAVAALCAMLAIFVADNFILTQVRLFTVTFQVRLAWALLIAFGVGVVVGVLLAVSSGAAVAILLAKLRRP
jgi:uncharacterized integral membrane protein